MLFAEHGRDTAAEQVESSEPNGHDARRSGTNVRMNDPQCVPNLTPCLAFGGRGRSETTVAASEDGHDVVSGWNNAEALLRPPFGTLPGPPGVTAFGFSSDGGLTWTDGGPPPAFAVGGDTIITASDPWLDRGGTDESTFYFANLAINGRRDPTT